MHRLPIGRSLLALAIATLGWWWWQGRPLQHPPGILVSQEPMQTDVTGEKTTIVGDFKLTAVARYVARGRVLGRKRYHSGEQSHLVPVDIALGWGRMSDQSILDQLGITMGNRFFFYQWSGAPPISPDEIMRCAANNHVIASNSAVASTISSLRIGSIAELEGWLVDADGPDGFRWRTSRRRDDTGNGACELFFVEKAHSWPEPPPAPNPSTLKTGLADY
jgi:hypothetical protein